MLIDHHDLQSLILSSGMLSTNRAMPSETAAANFAAGVIDRCAAMVEAMHLCEVQTDDVAEAYNVGITNSVEALRTASAILRRV